MRYRSFRRTACTAMLVGASSLAGCASLEPGDVAGKWSATMRELQIVPVFPPREDVRVGDIYFLRADTPEAVAAAESRNVPIEHSGYLPIPVLVGRLNLSDELNDQYSAGPMFGDTDSTHLDPSNTFSLQPTRDDAFRTGGNDRARIVGFPEFMSATYSSGDLSALVPVEALKVSAAAGFTSAKSVTVRVPVAESYCLPLSAVLAKLLDSEWRLNNITGNEGSFIPSHVTLLTDAKSDKIGVGDTVGYLRVITEVYMARVVDVSILGSASFGGAAKVEPLVLPSAPPEAPPAAGVPEGETPITPAPAAAGAAEAAAPPPPIARPAETAGPSANPTDLANRLNEQLDQQMAGLSPGVSTRFVSASAHSIGMRTTYERPVVIGYRGVLLRLAKRDAKGGLAVAGTLPINSMTPTAGEDEVPLPPSH